MEGKKETGQEPRDEAGSGNWVDESCDKKYHVSSPAAEATTAWKSSWQGKERLQSFVHIVGYKW